MADDEGESWQPEEEVIAPDTTELTPQEKLKLELQQLNAAQTSVAPPMVMLTPEQIAMHNKNQPSEDKKVVKTEKITPTDPVEQPITMDPNAPDLNQPDYSPKADANIKMLSTKSIPGKTFHPAVEAAIEKYANQYGLDPRMLRGFAEVESGGDPNANINKNTQYKGVMQIGTRDTAQDKSEWTKYGRGRSPYDPDANVDAAAQIMLRNKAFFNKLAGRDPTPAEYYLMHQQGPGFFSRGTMTNIAGNLPPDARTPENMTHEGFQRWWAARMERAMSGRGQSPTMRKVEDSNLPPGYLYGAPFAEAGDKELTKGGLADTPQAQAMIAELMRGTPLAQQSGTDRATREAAIAATRDPNARTRTLSRVPLSRERQQVPGEIPGSVRHTEPSLGPIPGITTPGEQALINAGNPSLMSTINNYQAMQQDALVPPPPVKDEINKPLEPTFMDKLKGVVASLTPQMPSPENAMTNESIKALLGHTPEESYGDIADAYREGFKKFDDDITKGGVAGLASMPGQMARGMGGWAATSVGHAFGIKPLTKWGIETQMEAPIQAAEWKKTYGVDPNNPTQAAAFKVGENFGKSPAGSVFNLLMAGASEKYLGPAAQYLGTNYPIPSIQLGTPANAATVFGKPPMVINTPGGPVTMNDADISQFVYGGVLAVGFGASFPLMAKGVRTIRMIEPYGLKDIFDPRRPVTGAPGTEAASLPIDKLKAGSLDPGKAALDILERQVKYDKAVAGGIDPLAANSVLQHWKVQTNSGAQSLIGAALKEGEMNAPEYRFNVKVPIAKLSEYAQQVPNFLEYIRLKIIGEEIAKNTATNKFLPPNSNQVKQTSFVNNVIDHTYTEANVAHAITTIEGWHPEIKQMYGHYRENMEAVRDFVSTHDKNAIEDNHQLTTHALKNPSMPIFSSAKKIDKLLNQYLDGSDPLKVAEKQMTRAFEAQMRFDAEQRYINVSKEYLGSKGFTKRESSWVNGDEGAGAVKAGAVLTRRHNGEVVHYTADPLLVSIFNSGAVPLSGLEQGFSILKSAFQKTTTGFFAPWFAPTGMIRAMEQGWTTAPANIRNAAGKRVMPSGPLATVMGVGSRLGPQMMRPTAKFFRETMNNTAWGRTLTFGQADLLARSFEKWYMDSAYRKLQVSGAFNDSSVMEGQEVAKSVVAARSLHGKNPHMNPVIDMMANGTDMIKKFLIDPAVNKVYKPINALHTIIQEAPAYEMARKTLKGSDENNRPTVGVDSRSVKDQMLGRNRDQIQTRELSDAEVGQMVFKNYTGDPSIRGYHKDKSGKLLRFDQGMGPSPTRAGLNPVQRGIHDTMRATWGMQNFGADFLNTVAHGSRSLTPWAGVLFQSPAATLAAMRDNPVRANLAFAASAVLPEVTAYLWNTYWSSVPAPVLDANGDPVLDTQGNPITIKYDYVNHMMNGRNEHNLMNNVYFAVPYEKPYDGVEFRHFQEVAFNRYMTRAFMHQYMGKNLDHMSEDVWKAMWGFLGTAVVPPMPSPLGAYLGSKGMVSTGGFMGSLFKSRNNPYVDLGGGESKTELVFRALIPAITDISLQAYQAGHSAPDWWSVPGAAVKQVGKRIIGRTAIIGDVARLAKSSSGSTSQSDELWDNKKVIDDLTYRYRVHDEGDSAIKTNKGSRQGRAYISTFDMGDLPPGSGKDLIANPGLKQPPPKNPLYGMLMSEIEKTFNKDEPKKGGIGFKAMWGLYGVYGQLTARMRTVNEGNAGTWVAEQLADPERMRWLQERNVNPLDFRDVTAYYQSRRNKVTQQILQTIKATEQRLGKQPEVQKLLKGKQFRINMLDPDELGINPDAHGMTPDPDY